MKYPWANVLLLFLVLFQVANGFWGLASGSEGSAPILWLHRAGGLAIVALLLWKGQNILGTFLRGRWHRARVPKTASLLLLGLLLAVLGLGVAWAHTGSFYFLGFSGVSWHIYLAVGLIPILLWHTLFHRVSLRRRFWAERRALLRAAGLLVAGVLLWRLGEAASAVLDLPGRGRRFTGSYEVGSFSGNAFPVTSWLNDNPSPIDVASWRLRVTGLVERPLELDYQELGQGQEEVEATLDCTGGWYSTQRWQGVPLARVLDRAGLLPRAASITVRSVTGYYRRFSLSEARGYLLATRVGGEGLSHQHGAPVRLVAPGKRGFQWVKWVVAVEVNDTSKWFQPPFPLQ